MKRNLLFIVTAIGIALGGSAYAVTFTVTQNTPFIFGGTTSSSVLTFSEINRRMIDVHVTLTGIQTNISANGIEDFDVLLVSPQGQQIILLSFVCENTNGSVDFTFAEEASGTLPQGNTTLCTSGTYLPSDFSQARGGYILDSPPAPSPPYYTDLTSLNGVDPYGDWTLYAEEFEGEQNGTIASWTLEITVADCDFPPYISTESLADGVEGVPYNQTLRISGGTPPYGCFVDSGNWPPGLTLDYSGIISGTPDVDSAGTYNFTILVDDAMGRDCFTTRDLSITIGLPDGCIYEDLFDDNALTWTEVKPFVTETGGSLVLTPTKKKAYTTSDPVFTGAQTGTTTVEIQFSASTNPKGKASMFTNWVDKKNFVEIQFNIAKGRVQLKQKAGSVVAKAKGDFTFAEDTLYTVIASFNGISYQVSIDGTVVATLTPSGTIPSGILGFSSRAITTEVNRACVAP